GLEAYLRSRGAATHMIDHASTSAEASSRAAAVLAAAGETPIEIVHVSRLGPERASARDAAVALDEVIGLVRAASDASARAGARARLWLVTVGAQAPGDDPSGLEPLQATEWGLGRVIALEHPEIWGGLIDLDPAV